MKPILLAALLALSVILSGCHEHKHHPITIPAGNGRTVSCELAPAGGLNCGRPQ